MCWKKRNWKYDKKITDYENLSDTRFEEQNRTKQKDTETHIYISKYKVKGQDRILVTNDEVLV